MGFTCLLCGKRKDFVGLHKIPKNPNTRHSWLTFCKLDENRDDISKVRICSGHFYPTDYVEPNAWMLGNKMMLKPDSVPTILKHNTSPSTPTTLPLLELPSKVQAQPKQKFSLTEIPGNIEMHAEEATLCLLCFTSCRTKCQIIDNTRKMMAFLLLKCDPKFQRPTLCDKCLEDLETCCNLKSRLLSNNCISPFNNEFDTETENVCSLCTKLVSSDFASVKDDTTSKILLSEYFPELVINSDSLLICVRCKVALETYTNQMRKWLQLRENEIVKEERCGTQCVLKEKPELHFLTNIKPDDNEVEDAMDVPCYLKTNETSIVTDMHEINIKQEDIDIKMDIEESDYKLYEDGVIRLPQSNTTVYTPKMQLPIHEGSLGAYKHQSDNRECPEITRRYAKRKFKLPSSGRSENHVSRDLERREHPETMLYKCVKCVFTTKFKRCLRRHLLLHKDTSEVTSYQCSECEFTTRHKRNLVNHLEVDEDPSKIIEYQCSRCEFKTLRRVCFNAHRRTHPKAKVNRIDTSKVYQCDKCLYLTNRKDYLKIHSVVHQSQSEARMFGCEECAFKTKHKHNLTKHAQHCHGKAKLALYQCEVCQYVTSYKRSLQKHLSVHYNADVTIYRCYSCEFATKYKNNLRSHVVTHLAGSEPLYSCEKCGFHTKHRTALSRHNVLHRDPEAISMHYCFNCDFRTKRKYSLKVHMKKHFTPPI